MRAPARAATGAAVAALLLGSVLLPDRLPLGVVLQGALYGTVTGLLALGLVLTYRSDRIVNFAYGAMGGLGGGVGVLLHLGQGWPYPLAVLTGVLTGAAIGGLTELLVVRRFARSSRLVLTVATIGLAQVLGGLQLVLPRLLGGPPLVGGFETPLSGASRSVGPVLFTGDALLVVAVVPLAVAGVAFLLLRTDAGTAVRAAADDRDRALLLGIPVRRLSTLVWVVAGTLASLAVLLAAPSQGLALTAGAGPALLLPALAAAVLAGLSSLPRAFAAGTALGVLDAVVRWNTPVQSVSTVAFLIVILLALLLQRRPAGRDGAESTLAGAAGSLRALPDAVRRLPEVRALRAAGLAAVVLGALALPLLTEPSTLRLASVALVYGMVAVSLVVLSGWAGQVSLGQFALVGVGGVLVGNVISRWNVDLFVALAGAGAAGALLAVLVGLPALRIRGLLLAVTTLALAVAVDGFVLNPVNFPALIPDGFDRPVLWKRFDLADERAMYLLCLGLLALVVLLVQGLQRARAGRVVVAVRDNERAAAAMAVPPVRVKLAMFVLSGAVAGVAGGLHALLLQAVGFGTYQPAESLLVLSMAVIGGLGSVGGALLGVAVVQLAVQQFPEYQLVLTGTGLLLVLLLLPAGLAGAAQSLRDRLVAPLARRHGLDLTPSAAGAGSPPPAVAPVVPVQRSVDEPAARPPLLRCREVQVRYGAVQVLFGVDLDVAAGEVVALLGTNGAGKSTLLKAAARLVPASGELLLEGEDLAALAPEELVGRGMVLMPGKSVFAGLTVEENLRVACWPLRHDAEAVRTARDRVGSLFPVLDERRGRLAGDLSGGQQQMLSMAMALVTAPRLLLIDELSLGLAPTVVSQLLEVVRELAGGGVTVVLVEQSVNVALELAERAVFLEKGQVRFSGPTADLLDRPDVLRSVFLGDSAARTSVREPERLAPPEDATVVLEALQLRKSFGGVTALDAIDLQLREGEVLGLLGHNGAGKTTLFDALCGFLSPDSGRVLLGGIDVTALPPSERAVRGLGRSFQEARLFPGLTVEQTVAVALERHLWSSDLVAAALRLPASTLSESAVAVRVGELLEELGLARYAETPVSVLSTGTRRIVELACVLAQEPTVLLLDEPSGGVAQKETEALVPLLRDVQRRTGCSVLVIEHDMPMLTSLCDRLVALELGRVIAEGSAEQVLHHPDVVASYLGDEQSAAVQRSGARGAREPGARLPG